VHRALLTIVVALLTISASGLSSLVIGEPCTAARPSSHNDAACPPTCVACGCCAQAAEPVNVALTTSPLERTTDIAAAFPPLPLTIPRDILHVPRPGLV
jgi:hypothetical protein